MLNLWPLEDRSADKATCQQVRLQGRLRVNRTRHIALVVADGCVQCGTRVVQCPEDARVFAYPDGRTTQPDEVRRYKLNLSSERAKATRAEVCGRGAGMPAPLQEADGCRAAVLGPPAK